MPLPLIIGIGAAIAGAMGVGAGIHGGIKMKEASDSVKSAQRRNEQNVACLENSNKITMQMMDKLGKYEMEIISTFERFSVAFEKIKNPPSFAEIKKDNVMLSVFTPQEVKDAAVGASVLLAGLGGAAWYSERPCGCRSERLPLLWHWEQLPQEPQSLHSGAAATNATLAALGGGSLAAGGGGIALGTAVLGGATLGVGLLIGGIIFSVAGSSVSDKADKAWSQMMENEKKINSICDYLDKLKNIAKSFHSALFKINNLYMNHLIRLEAIIEEQEKKKFFLMRLFSKKVDYNKFSDEQKQITKNTILLVGLLYEMCKVQLVEKTENDDELNKINEEAIIHQIEQSEEALSKIDSVA